MSRWRQALLSARARHAIAGAEPAASVTLCPLLSPDLDAFIERVAIAAIDGGAPRDEAERMAAIEQGFADLAAFRSAVVADWRARIQAMLAKEHSHRGRSCLQSADRFLREGWAEQALAAGWPELSLFGVCAVAPWERLDRMGAAYSSFPVTGVTADEVLYVGGARPLRQRRAAPPHGAVLPWAIA